MPNETKVIQLEDGQGNPVSPVVNVGSIYSKNGQKVDNLLSYTVAGTGVPVPEITDITGELQSEVNQMIQDGQAQIDAAIADIPSPSDVRTLTVKEGETINAGDVVDVVETNKISRVPIHSYGVPHREGYGTNSSSCRVYKRPEGLGLYGIAAIQISTRSDSNSNFQNVEIIYGDATEGTSIRPLQHGTSTSVISQYYADQCALNSTTIVLSNGRDVGILKNNDGSWSSVVEDDNTTSLPNPSLGSNFRLFRLNDTRFIVLRSVELNSAIDVYIGTVTGTSVTFTERLNRLELDGVVTYGTNINPELAFVSDTEDGYRFALIVPVSTGSGKMYLYSMTVSSEDAVTFGEQIVMIDQYQTAAVSMYTTDTEFITIFGKDLTNGITIQHRSKTDLSIISSSQALLTFPLQHNEFDAVPVENDVVACVHRNMAYLVDINTGSTIDSFNYCGTAIPENDTEAAFITKVADAKFVITVNRYYSSGGNYSTYYYPLSVINGTFLTGVELFRATTAIALENGLSGQAVKVGFRGTCPCTSATVGDKITSGGVTAVCMRTGEWEVTGADQPNVITIEYTGNGDVPSSSDPDWAERTVDLYMRKPKALFIKEIGSGIGFFFMFGEGSVAEKTVFGKIDVNTTIYLDAKYEDGAVRFYAGTSGHVGYLPNQNDEKYIYTAWR